jgi:Domain of unknown function (DUF4189)
MENSLPVRIIFLFAIFACLIIERAPAENGCPNGYEPWKIPVESSSDCMALPDYGNDSVAQPRSPIWETRWGAVAIGAAGGGGAVTDMRSERQAKNAAVKQCKKTVGNQKMECKALAYYNQCVVVAWGSTGYVTQSAEDIPTASVAATQRCSEKHADCEVYYSGSSYPKLVH